MEVVTYIENIKHSIENDLAPKGERHKNSKYTDDLVHSICRCFEDGMNNIETFEVVFNKKYDKIDSEHKLELNFIGRVRRGDRWKHISSQYDFTTKIYGTELHRNI